MTQFSTRLFLLAFLIVTDKLYSTFIVDHIDLPIGYFVAAIVGTMTVIFLSFFKYSPIVRDVQIINIVWVVVHFMGYLLYMSYYPPAMYDLAQTVLYAAQIFRLIWVTNDDKRYSDDTYRGDIFHHIGINLCRNNNQRAN